MLLATLFVGGLALLAQFARKSRGAEITLIIAILALSLLLGGLGAVTGLGLLLKGVEGEAPFSEQLAFGAAGIAAMLVGIFGVALCVPPLRKVTGRRMENDHWGDPPFFLAMWLLVAMLANNAVSFLIFAGGTDVNAIFPSGRLTLGEIATSQLPFVVVALAGVGLGVQRDFRETLHRLGYGSISLAHLGMVVIFVAAALALSVAADALFSALQPDLYRTVGDLSQSLFDPAGLGPTSAIVFSLLIGFGAALGEETLFRGAVQPRLGLILTSILFASLHIQYGPSVLLGYVFLLSVGLGLLRRYINTTASFIAHAAYNAFGVLLAYFLGF